MPDKKWMFGHHFFGYLKETGAQGSGSARKRERKEAGVHGSGSAKKPGAQRSGSAKKQERNVVEVKHCR